MTVFADTSGLYAVFDDRDQNHARARRAWTALVEGEDSLVCTNYIVLETVTLLQERLGLDAVRLFQENLLPLLSVEWVDTGLHLAGMAAVLTAARRDLSLTDCISFEVMRRRGIRKVFTFDRHFREQGFEGVA